MLGLTRRQNAVKQSKRLRQHAREMLLPLLGQYCRTEASTQNVSQKEKEKKSLPAAHKGVDPQVTAR